MIINFSLFIDLLHDFVDSDHSTKLFFFLFEYFLHTVSNDFKLIDILREGYCFLYVPPQNLEN